LKESPKKILLILLIVSGFKNYTEIDKYRPEVIDYNLTLDKIKEVFTKEDYKVILINQLVREFILLYLKIIL